MKVKIHHQPESIVAVIREEDGRLIESFESSDPKVIEEWVKEYKK